MLKKELLEKLDKYKRIFSRDFSLANIEIWYRAESLNEKGWTLNKQQFLPYIVFWKKENTIEVYYGLKGFKWMTNELKSKLSQDKTFLETIEKVVLEKIKPIKKIYEEIKVLNREELIKFLSDFENAYPWLEAMWFLCELADDLKDFDLSSLLKIRTETNNLAPNTELVIRKSIENCYPNYKNHADVISGNEIRQNKIPNINELEKRKEFFFTNNELYVGVTKEFIEKKFNLQIEEIKYHDVKELKGKIAYKGIIRGTVKIITGFQEINKVKKGDIIVASQTMPDILQAMHKAAAFVTDEGGTLSHAAIISRELKKPCIIGTKIATKIFKDGDLIEVDANKGIVKIIK